MRVMNSGADACAVEVGCVAKDVWLQSATAQRFRVRGGPIDMRARE